MVRHARSRKHQRRYTLAGVVVSETIKGPALSKVVNHLQIGASICTEKDTFVRKKGRTIAIGRAYKRPIVMIPAMNTQEENEKIFNDFCKEFPEKFSDKLCKPVYQRR